MFGTARFLLRAGELEAIRAPHSVQSPWYVGAALDDVIEDRIEVLGGDVELGSGIALVATPGRTAGHQSLVLNTADGVWVVSGNGVAADCWQPLLSKLPGVRRGAEAEGREVVLASAAAEDLLALYDSMVLERSLADASRSDPRWLMILPTQELAPQRRQWPALATFSHGGLALGTVVSRS
jgi:hypothetical protein